MYSHSPGRQHTHGDKSAPATYCKPEGGRDPDESVSHTDPSARVAEPESHLEASCQHLRKATSDTARKRSLRIPPRRIALSGGGVRAVAHVGALKVLDAHGYLRCVEEVLGVSAGALFALMMTLRYSMDEIERLGLQVDFTIFRNPDADVLLLFPETFGMDRGESLERLIASVLRHKGFAATTTFADLAAAATGPRFRCFATDIEAAESREFSAAVTPGVLVTTAIRASMSIPIYYTPVVDPLTGAHLMDGGIIDNVPIGHTPFLDDCWSLIFINPPLVRSSPQEKDIPQLLKNIYSSIIMNRYVQHRKTYGGSLIEIPCGDVSPMHFDISLEERVAIIACAARAAEAFLFTPARRSARRVSAS